MAERTRHKNIISVADVQRTLYARLLFLSAMFGTTRDVLLSISTRYTSYRRLQIECVEHAVKNGHQVSCIVKLYNR